MMNQFHLFKAPFINSGKTASGVFLWTMLVGMVITGFCLIPKVIAEETEKPLSSKAKLVQRIQEDLKQLQQPEEELKRLQQPEVEKE